MRHHVSDTAFLVNESRARRPELSRDHFSRQWIPEERRPVVAALWERYAAAVYPHDDLELGLRCRHYLRWIGKYAGAHPGGMVLALGAGLVSYPCLLPAGPRWIEVDLPWMVDFKQARADALAAEGTLPERTVRRHAVDLGDVDAQARLLDDLGDAFAARPTCVVLEGLVYYLPGPACDTLFERIAAVQRPGSLLLFDYWAPEAVDHPVFARQAAFFGEEMDFAAERYHLVGHDDAARPGYRVLEQGGVGDKAASLGLGIPIPDERELLPEHSVVLERE